MKKRRNKSSDECITNFKVRTENLLKEADTKLKEIAAKDGSHFNVFFSIKKERDEVLVHSHIICDLLNCKCDLGHNTNFLRLFLEQLDIPEEYLEEKWKVERERTFKAGRIDFVLECDRFCIVIEMKIDAGDQYTQLQRYEFYCKSRNKEYRIYYLTLYGHEPSEQSKGEMESDVYLISFKKHITEWLKKCEKLSENEKYKQSFILQYLAAIECITGQGEHMKDLIGTVDEARAVLALYDGLKQKMEEIPEIFCQKLENYINTELEDLLKYSTKVEKYTGNGSGTWTLLAKDRGFGFGVAVVAIDNLYCAIGFTDNSNNNDWVDDKNKEIKSSLFYDKWIKKVSKVSDLYEHWNIQGSENKILFIKFPLKNTDGEEIDLKNFNDSALKLINDNEIDKQVKHIGRYVVDEVIKKLI